MFRLNAQKCTTSHEDRIDSMRTVVQELKAVTREFFLVARTVPGAESSRTGGVKAAGGAAREEGEDVVCAQCFCTSRASLCVHCPAQPGEHSVCEGCFGDWVRQQLAGEERARFVACGARIVCPLCLPLQTPFLVDR